MIDRRSSIVAKDSPMLTLIVFIDNRRTTMGIQQDRLGVVGNQPLDLSHREA